MTVTKDDFEKVWASQSPLTPYSFSDAQYKEGWNFVGATPPSRQMWDAFMQNADEKLKYLYQHEDVPLGHEYFTFNPNVPQGSLPLFGGEYDRATYSDLWAWVQTQTGYLKTEAEWQTLSTANNGNVPFYSDGDGSTTFRVPSLKCWIKGANGTVSEVGSYLAAGLPNITGEFEATTSANSILRSSSGAFSLRSPHVPLNASAGSGTGYQYAQFDASASNSIYGNSTTVQPESIVGMWLVKAYGVIVDTGQIDEQQYIDDRFNASKQYTQDYFAGQMQYKGNILLAKTTVNSVQTINVDCSGYKFVTVRFEGNPSNVQDMLVPVGSDFYFAIRIFGNDAGSASLRVNGNFDTVNGQLIITSVSFSSWTSVGITVIGAI